jgi:serine/threonine-protein kinase
MALETDPFEGTAYRGVEHLEWGDTGEVFVVEHRQLGRKLAAKTLRAELAGDPRVLDRLRLEAQVLGRLNHPNIVSVTGFGKMADGRPFLVMDLLRGRTLRAEILERGALPANEALHCARELLAGLGAAHALGIVHRDVTPDNVFLADANGGRSVKIFDFGAARVLPDAPARAPHPLSLPTESDAVIGAPRFSSPEAAQGEPVDARADLYGAALVLYTMLTGSGPFDHLDGQSEVLRAHANETPAPPSRRSRRSIPRDVDRIVLKALEKDPASRFQTAAEFSAELERVQAGLPLPVGWLDTSALAREPPRSRRGESARALVLLFVVGLVVSALAAAVLVALVMETR